MKKSICFFIGLMLFLFHANVNAQDTLVYRRTGQVVLVKVIEISPSFIYYKIWPVHDSAAIQSVKKMRLQSVRLLNGERLIFVSATKVSPEAFTEQRRILIKTEPMLSMRKSSSLWLEYAFHPKVAAQVGCGMIGTGWAALQTGTEKLQGNEWSAGVKFYLLNVAFMSPEKRKLLQGFYLAPEFNMISYTSQADFKWQVDTNGVMAAEGVSSTIYQSKGWNLSCLFGYQRIFDFGLSLEVNISAGIGKRTEVIIKDGMNDIPHIPLPNGGYRGLYNIPLNDDFVDYGYSAPERGVGLTLHSRLKVGYLIGPRWKKK